MPFALLSIPLDFYPLMASIYFLLMSCRIQEICIRQTRNVPQRGKAIGKACQRPTIITGSQTTVRRKAANSCRPRRLFLAETAFNCKHSMAVARGWQRGNPTGSCVGARPGQAIQQPASFLRLPERRMCSALVHWSLPLPRPH